MVCVRMNISKRESDLYSSLSSPTLMRDRMVTDHIRKRLRIQNEQSPGGPHKSEVKERILLHSQLLLVSYLVHRYYLCPISFTDTTSVLSHSQLLVSCLIHSYYLCPILFTDTTCVLSHSQILLVSYLVHRYYFCPIIHSYYLCPVSFTVTTCVLSRRQEQKDRTKSQIPKVFSK